MNERPVALRNELAALQEKYYRELDEVNRRGVLADGYADPIRSLKALRKASGQLDDYLDTGFFRRTFSEAKALDREQLRAIADDLKAVTERLKPLVLPD